MDKLYSDIDMEDRRYRNKLRGERNQRAIFPTAAVPSAPGPVQAKIDQLNPNRERSVQRQVVEGAGPEALYTQGKLTANELRDLAGQQMTKEKSARQQASFIGQGQAEIAAERYTAQQAVDKETAFADETNKAQMIAQVRGNVAAKLASDAADKERDRKRKLLQGEVDAGRMSQVEADRASMEGNVEEATGSSFVSESEITRQQELDAMTPMQKYEAQNQILPDGRTLYTNYLTGEQEVMSAPEDTAAASQKEEMDNVRKRATELRKQNSGRRGVDDSFIPDMTPAEAMKEAYEEAQELKKLYGIGQPAPGVAQPAVPGMAAAPDPGMAAAPKRNLPMGNADLTSVAQKKGVTGQQLKVVGDALASNAAAMKGKDVVNQSGTLQNVDALAGSFTGNDNRSFISEVSGVLDNKSIPKEKKERLQFWMDKMNKSIENGDSASRISNYRSQLRREYARLLR